MSAPGSNLPGFREAQLEFAAHIRNPEVNPPPRDVEERRMRIYLELFYNNIESFLASSFPVAKKILTEQPWHALVRQFVHTHPSESPYFLEISQEFLTFLDQRLGSAMDDPLPDCLLELCHYEWVELALSVSEVEFPLDGVDPEADLLKSRVVISPLIWCLAYRYPVHQIGPDRIPQEPPEAGTELIVYRSRDDEVKFMVVNAWTLRLIELLRTAPSGAAALQTLVDELGADTPAAATQREKIVYEQGIATMQRLREAEIILGAKV